MEISGAFHKQVLEAVQQYHKFDGLELEGRYTGVAARKQFDNCITYCKSDSDFVEDINDESLDILTKDKARVTIVGRQKVQDYCRTNTVPEGAIVIKKSVESNPIVFDDIDFKINLKKEQPIEDTSIVDNLYMQDKSYRMKKRYSYTNKKEGVRIDLTVVRASYGGFKSFMESKIFNKPDAYEIEVEVVGKKEPKQLASAFLNHMLNLYGALAEEDHVCPKSEKQGALREYLEMAYKSFDSNFLDTPRRFFAGPQPVTLERKNITEPGLGVTTIRENYTVTEKADGERCLLFVNKVGRCYFINSRLKVRYTGVSLAAAKSCLLDGELITNLYEGNEIHIALFDCYWYSGEDVRGLPLVGKTKSRLWCIEDLAKKAKKAFADEGMSIYGKEFLSAGDIFENSAEILKKARYKSYPYNIDGLVFTPALLPVGAMFQTDLPGRPVETWPMVFKWKPPEDNTIDFLVRYKKGVTNNRLMVFVNSVPHNVLELYVGYNPANWERITALRYLQGAVSKKREYTKRSFMPEEVGYEGISECYIPKDFTTKEEGDEIEDDSIVEFKYDNTDDQPPFQTKWSPIRIRKDKNEMYRQTRALSGAANDYGTAMNIWRSIRQPVTQEMICGTVKIDKMPPGDDVYYDRKIDRRKFASKAMLEFHNSVKRKLIEGTKASSLVDMACGKGGDLNKFLNSKIERVLGFDYNRDNIENPVDGIYSRLMDRRDPNIAKYRYAFLPMDLSERINLETIQNPDDKTVAGVLYGHTRDAKLSRYHGMASEKFDVVSCQFAVHYFFESERKLDAFLYNVDMHLKDGGQFIGTCLDGHALKRLLGNENEASGEKDGRTLWSIKRLYEKSVGVNYGEKIEVFIESIGRVIGEYLVNVDLLHKKLKALGYEKVETKGFGEFYDDTFDLDAVQRRYSEMNTTFVFRKGPAAAPRKTFKKKVVAVPGGAADEEGI